MGPGGSGAITLHDAVGDLYQIAVRDEKSTSTRRLAKLAAYCVQELARRGLPNAEPEVTIEGGGRPKNWDVAWRLHGKYRLVISLKSILKNLGGTVPNRIDDLIGEVANIQMYSPEVAAGYIMIFDVAQDNPDEKWCNLLEKRLRQLSGRKPPSWSVGMVEAFTIVKVDFSKEPTLVSSDEALAHMFDRLVAEVKKRNPSTGI